MPRLQVLNGKRQGTLFEVPQGSEHVIGHRQSATIAIDDPWVSWDHARLFFNGDGNTCWIEDLGSTNGTYVNCVRVKREQLRHEDIIFLGKTHVIFLSPVEEFGGPPPAPAPGLAAAAGAMRRPGAAPGFPPPPPPPPAPPLDVPSSHAMGFPGESSSFGGAFESGSSAPLVGGSRNPFASTGSPQTPAPLWSGSGSQRGSDPFSDSSVDPFSSGPDYSDLSEPETAPSRRGLRDDDLSFLNPKDPDPALDYRPNTGTTFPAGVPSGSPFHRPPSGAAAGLGFPDLSGDPSSDLQLPLRPKKPSNPFAETRGDEQLPLGQERGTPTGRSLSLSDLQYDGEPDLPAPTSQEIADLIEDSRRLRADQFQERAVPLEEVPPSEMRTRQIDTDRMAKLLEDHAAAAGLPKPPPPPPPAAAPAETPAPGAGDLAFEAAKLRDEVRRLRAALQAAQQQNPDAVRLAAAALRDQELGHLARRVAEQERELAQLRGQLTERESELNLVTEDMIDKEDTIDRLRDQVTRLSSGSRPGAVPFGAPGEDDLSSLEF